MINAAILGCGYWGAKHARVCHELPQCVLYALADYDRPKAEALAETYPCEKIYSDVESLCADPKIDAVVVATPASTHYDLAIKLLQAKKHVLVEKPLCVLPDEASRLIEAARSGGRTLMVGHTFEFNPSVEALRKIVAGGELGKLYYLEFARLNLGLYQRDVNVVYDLSPHDISVMIYVLGERPTQVRARGYSMVHGQVVDVAYIEYMFASGVVANSRVSWLAPQKIREMTIVGSQKMAVYDDAVVNEPIRIFEKHIAPPVETEKFEDWRFAYHYGPITSVPVEGAEPLKQQMEHFIDCIRTGATPRTSGQSGRNVVCVLDAIQKSLGSSESVVNVNYD